MLCTTAESQDGIGALDKGGEIPSVHFFEKLKKSSNNFCNVVQSTERTGDQCVSEHPELFQRSQMVM